MPLTLKEQEEKIRGCENLLETTCSWWSERIQMAMSKFNYYAEKLKNEWSEETFAKMQELELDIKNLNTKKEWELREYNKLQKQQEELVKRQSKDFMVNLSSKLSQKFKQRQQ